MTKQLNSTIQETFISFSGNLSKIITWILKHLKVIFLQIFILWRISLLQHL